MSKCDVCSAERNQSWAATRSVVFSSRKPSKLQDSINKGCLACAMLRKGIERFETMDPDHTPLDRIHMHSKGNDEQFEVYLGAGTGNVLEFFRYTGKNEKQPVIKNRSTVPLLNNKIDISLFRDWESSNSSASLLWVKEKIENCTKTHTRCKQMPNTGTESNITKLPASIYSPNHTLPTRVLDLRQFPEGMIRVLETDSSLCESYACLSHCWGKSKPLSTTRDNIVFFKDGIPWESFPKVFQHAITFTKDLQISFLWIDCLCIIQGDEDDWAKEAASMASIYQDSIITLAATASPGCDGALLHNFQPKEIHKLLGLDESDNTYDIYVRKKTLHWNDCPEKELYLKFPLVTRAWAYQERLLAPRVLHFCAEELIWECMEEWICQCGSFGSDGSPKKAHAAAVDPTQIAQSSRGDGDNGVNDIGYNNAITVPSDCAYVVAAPEDEFKIGGKVQARSVDTLVRHDAESYPSNEASATETRKKDHTRNWHHIVEDYSKLRLTYDSDRFPALAGLAKTSRRHFEHKYLAGVWEDNLPQSLLWTTKNGEKASRPIQHSPPTWSWASTTGCVTFKDFDPDNFLLCHINDANSTPTHASNPMGEVSAGRLVISGRLQEMYFHYPKAGIHGTKPESKYHLSTERYSFAFAPDFDLAAPSVDQINEGQRLYCLAILTDPSVLYALVLTCINEEKQIYKRVGVMNKSLGTLHNAQIFLPEWQNAAAKSDDTSRTNKAADMTTPNLLRTESKQELSYAIAFDGMSPSEFTTLIKSYDDTKIIVVKSPRHRWDNSVILAKLTHEQAPNTYVRGNVSLCLWEVPAMTFQERERGEWYLTAQMAQRKREGKSYFRFMGQRVTIV
jgi:hypothetical protein